MPAGYAPLAYSSEGGIDLEGSHLMMHASKD
jgi:hypothetical protein